MVLLFALLIIYIHDVNSSWPVYGGSISNQQAQPNDGINKIDLLNDNNIKNIYELCSYQSIGSTYFYGFITVDDNNVAYFADTSGNVISIYLETCEEKWRTNIAAILGYNDDRTQIVSRNSVTLFETSTGIEAILLGAPNSRLSSSTYDAYFGPCFAIALHRNNGTLLWKTMTGNGLNDTSKCHSHGFIVDNENKFAFGGLSSSSTFHYIHNIPLTFVGRMIKIDVNTGNILHTFYNIPLNKSGLYKYTGCGSWNFPAMSGNYLVYGAGNLMSYPDYISECMSDFNFTKQILFTNNPINPCNHNLSETNVYWRCLEKDIFVDSIIILNKYTFKIQHTMQLNGVDAWNAACVFSDNSIHNCPIVNGPDADVTAIASYSYNNISYVSVLPKSGHFYVFNIEDGTLHISKKIGPSSNGGGGVWSLGIDEINMIAIATITGAGTPPNGIYPMTMANGTIICVTGTTHGIDLLTGFTLYQIVNPYGRIDVDECNMEPVTNYIDLAEQALNNGSLNGEKCEIAPNNEPMLDPKITAFDKVYITESISNIIPIDGINRARNVAPITISNNMIFIPSITGDIFIHNIKTGEFIHRLECPNYFDNNTMQWNRAGIHGGVTVLNDRIIFYCGANSNAANGNQVISMKLRDNKTNTVWSTITITLIIVGIVLLVVVVVILLHKNHIIKTQSNYEKI